jgi:DNA-binding NtrC family response regulator
MAPPTESPIRLVAVDDDPASLDLITDALDQDGLEILTASDPDKGWELIQRVNPEIVMLDLRMPKVGGMELLERTLEWYPGTDVILLTGHYSTESAVEAIRKGAYDYLTKPISIADLRQKMAKLLEEVGRRHEAVRLEGELLETSRFENMVGRSPEMLDLFIQIRRVAPHYRTLLITGDTGTGKELAARAVHNQSPVSSGPFVTCNCSAIVETLFESELFGHVKGSFTGATQDRVGMFEYANGGTLFLDEIGDVPLAMQAKLLRVLQNQEIQRVGSPVVRNVDVHVVAATNRDLGAMIAEKKFREDLYYRLSMVELHLPRLADRKEDLPLLLHHLVERFAKQYDKPIRGISRRAQVLLAQYAWPGNVRELENVIGNACMMTAGETIDVRDLPERLRKPKPHEASPEVEVLLPMEEMERRHALYVLQRMGGNKVRAAQALGISRATLYRILGEVAEEKERTPGF